MSVKGKIGDSKQEVERKRGDLEFEIIDCGVERRPNPIRVKINCANEVKVRRRKRKRNGKGGWLGLV